MDQYDIFNAHRKWILFAYLYNLLFNVFPLREFYNEEPEIQYCNGFIDSIEANWSDNTLYGKVLGVENSPLTACEGNTLARIPISNKMKNSRENSCEDVL